MFAMCDFFWLCLLRSAVLRCCMLVLPGELGSAWLCPLCSSYNFHDVQRSSYIRKNIDIFCCACFAAIDETKSEIATRTSNYLYVRGLSRIVCFIMQILRVCIIWAGPDHLKNNSLSQHEEAPHFYDEARERSKTFFLGFPRKKKGKLTKSGIPCLLYTSPSPRDRG